jgi:hypothetical protein
MPLHRCSTHVRVPVRTPLHISSNSRDAKDTVFTEKRRCVGVFSGAASVVFLCFICSVFLSKAHCGYVKRFESCIAYAVIQLWWHFEAT